MTKRKPGARRGRPRKPGPKPFHASTNGQADAQAALPFTWGSEFQASGKREFLWEGHVAFGGLTLVEGPKGVGKSTLLAAMAADITGGPRLTPQRSSRAPQHVVWFTGEEHPVLDTRPKIRAAGGIDRLVCFPGRDQSGKLIHRLALPAEIGLLADLVKMLSARLVILDPWSSCLASGASTADPVNTRHTMETLAALGQATDAAVVVTRNFRKTRIGGALESGLGSIEASNVARAVIQLRPHPDHHRRYVCVVAAANGFAQPTPFGYRIEPREGAVVMEAEEQLDLTADQLAEGDITSTGRDERRDCLSILQKCVEGSWVPFRDLEQEALRAGICVRTLRSVKAELQLPSRRKEEQGHVHYEWGPPPRANGQAEE